MIQKIKQFVQEYSAKYPQRMEFVRFVIVGAITTLLDMVVMATVLYAFEPSKYTSFISLFVGANPSTVATIVGTACGFVAGLLLSYLLSVIYVFNAKEQGKSVKGFVLFVLLSAGGLGIHTLGMYLGYDLLHINEWVVKVVLTFVVLVYNYFTKRLLIFKEEKNETNN